MKLNMNELTDWRNTHIFPNLLASIEDAPENWTKEGEENHLKGVLAVEDAEVWVPGSMNIDARPFLRFLWAGSLSALRRTLADWRFWIALMLALGAANDSGMLDWVWRGK